VFFKSEENVFILKTSYAKTFGSPCYSGSADNIVGQLGLKTVLLSPRAAAISAAC
jgi:hypothetical protein